MLKSLMLAGGIALGAMALSPAAEARTNVSVYLGVPFYTYQAEPDWEYYDGYGWYDADAYGDFDRYRERDRYRDRDRADFQVYFGVPFYSHRVEPDWRYYEGYGWYDYPRYGEFERERHHGNRAISCAAARQLVKDEGYRNVKVVQCNGRTYVFKAKDRRGHKVTVRVNARNGNVF